MSIAVRAANHSDLALLATLHNASFEEAWNEKDFEALLNANNVFALLAGTVSNDWQSFALARVAAGEAEILSLGTTVTARHKGLAHALVLASAREAAKRGAHEIFLEVSAANAPARGLYLGLGFAKVGLRRGYYRHLDGTNADALTLRAALPLAHR